MERSVKRWARERSTPARPVRPYFIWIGFRDILQPEQRHFINQIPTSVSLTDEQVDQLIAAGRELLRNDPGFQRVLAELGGARASGDLRLRVHSALRTRRCRFFCRTAD